MVKTQAALTGLENHPRQEGSLDWNLRGKTRRDILDLGHGITGNDLVYTDVVQSPSMGCPEATRCGVECFQKHDIVVSRYPDWFFLGMEFWCEDLRL